MPSLGAGFEGTCNLQFSWGVSLGSMLQTQHKVHVQWKDCPICRVTHNSVGLPHHATHSVDVFCTTASSVGRLAQPTASCPISQYPLPRLQLQVPMCQNSSLLAALTRGALGCRHLPIDP